MKRIWIERPACRVLWWILLLCAVAAFLGASLLGVLRFQLLNPAFYQAAESSEEVDRGLHAAIISELALDCEQNSFPTERIEAVVTLESISAAKEDYMNRFFEALFSGGNLEEIQATYDLQPISDTIDAWAAETEDPRIYAQKKNRALLAESLHGLIVGNIGTLSIGLPLKAFVIAQGYLAAAQRLTGYFWPCCVTAALLCLLLAAAAALRRSRRLFYAESLALLFSAELLFVPLFMIGRYRIADRLSLEEGALLCYLRALLERVISFNCLLFGVFAACFLLMLLIVVFFPKKA